MAINAITGFTRSWIMGQGHCVAAIDTVNLLLNNMTPAHAERYSLTEEGLTKYVRDFYSYKMRADGKQDSPLGSHVNAHTAGGLAEGGYLGFTELQYVHMPLPGERLVVFLSDGAFEEQRGSDWIPRWWRARDCGLVTPIMIKNGRRIDQRTTMSQQGGADWFVDHLKLNGFDPIIFDGRDPAAFAWAIFEMEYRLEAAAKTIQSKGVPYALVERGTISPEDIELFKYVETAEEAWEMISRSYNVS
jgi:phosphoketolase